MAFVGKVIGSLSPTLNAVRSLSHYLLLLEVRLLHLLLMLHIRRLHLLCVWDEMLPGWIESLSMLLGWLGKLLEVSLSGLETRLLLYCIHVVRVVK